MAAHTRNIFWVDEMSMLSWRRPHFPPAQNILRPVQYGFNEECDELNGVANAIVENINSILKTLNPTA